ncbi:acetoacetate--CoA ligase [Streptomyces cathayae]|uniref:Acetoacetate--CoA ligase n=1 Tax=Streptomyces cathayae TaxID=3031124 RepID=A0ABY8K0I4_9ACTN|nr:acetoacetate--CoA ligase [Streptomyces sp. HUAS 5]WGD40073.1 acetoacetate--CoA ligase [Streptomyces sp. HUAS 5]
MTEQSTEQTAEQPTEQTTGPATEHGLAHGDLLFTPGEEQLTSSRLAHYLDWLARERGLRFDRRQLWEWSVTDLEGFWGSIWDHFDVLASVPPERVLASARMPGAEWFPGARLNYAEQVFRHTDDDRVAIHAYSQTREPTTLTLGELRDQVARARTVLRRQGVGPGSRVVAHLPNLPETVVAFLATASLGAAWASCATEFGARSVIDRFGQVEPTVLLVASGYTYGDKPVDKSADVAELVAGLPTLTVVFDVEYGSYRATGTHGSTGAQGNVSGMRSWPEALAAVEPEPLTFEQVPFDHPLVVLFSSGTTGLPKAIVHGHGGILLEHLKCHALSWDLGPGDTFLWYSTTAWMMWNALVSGLLVGSSIVCIDGNPVHPDLDWQWRLAEETGATVMGAAPGFIMASRKAGLRPARDHRLRIRQFASAGAPLPPEGYAWIYDQLPGVVLNIGSGGTDVCSGIVQGDPLLPVWAGEISGAALGVAARAFDGAGHEVVGELGELVITAPMPSMPIGFWGDADGSRLRAAYFDRYPGVWRHGDWIVFSPEGHCHVAGRSDATLNRGGVRLGTAEFYRVVEELPGVQDSLVVHLEQAGGNGDLVLFVQTEPGRQLDAQLRAMIVGALRHQLSPRHVPDTITEVAAVPRNRTGKKLELPVKRILQGHPIDEVASRDALADPHSLDAFVDLAAARNTP